MANVAGAAGGPPVRSPLWGLLGITANHSVDRMERSIMDENVTKNSFLFDDMMMIAIYLNLQGSKNLLAQTW